MNKDKRCKSRDSIYRKRCEKPRGHEIDNPGGPHQHGAIVWVDHGPIRGHKPTATIKDEPSTFARFGGLGRPTMVTFSTDTGERDISAFVKDLKFDGQWMAPPPKAKVDPQAELEQWWRDLATAEIERTVPKAIEYSSTDLTDIGHDLARCMGREVDDEEAAELGVFFYLRGKVARWVGAVINGERVSDDTLFDIGVYVRMAQRIRLTGNWPGVNFNKEDNTDG